MPLGTIQVQFEQQLTESIRVYEELATTRTFSGAADFKHEDICQLEGVLSHVWQAWCRFCRSVAIESCLGTVDLSGRQYIGVIGANSDNDVSGASIRIRKHRYPIWGYPNNLLRNEPTWGDVDVLIDIIQGTAPANSGSLLGMCTMAGPSANILQTIRNAAAHHNHQTMSEVHRIGSQFSTFPLTHPCQSLFWIDLNSKRYLFPEAVDSLSTASMFAVL